jgi:hypothetical protein
MEPKRFADKEVIIAQVKFMIKKVNIDIIYNIL